MGVEFVNDKANKKFNIKEPWYSKISKKLHFNSLLTYAIFLILIGILFYFIQLVTNYGVIDWGGDYTAQYFVMGFHTHDIWSDFFKTGQMALWDKSIYLGSNSVASNSYYGLYSPYNFFIIIFPRDWVPWTSSIISIIKLMVAGLLFRTYMKYMGVKETTARLAGLAYAFCGFMCFYLWYNNYQDLFSFFPLLLLGIEKIIKENKPWILMIAVPLCISTNFVMAITFLLCSLIYALFRYFQRLKLNTAKKNLKILGVGFIGYFIGVCISCVILMPSLISILNSPKVEGSSYLESLSNALKTNDFKEFFGLIFDWRVAKDQHGRAYGHRVWMPIMELFFPPDTCRSMNLIEYAAWDFDDISTSLWVFTPSLLFLVPAFIKSIREKKISHFIAIAFFLFAIFCPFMYFALQGFTNAYGRWSIFLTVSILIYTFLYIDKLSEEPKWRLHTGLAFALLGILASGLITYCLVEKTVYPILQYRLVDSFNFTYLALGLEVAYVIIVYIVCLLLYQRGEVLKKFLIGFVSLEVIVCGVMMYCGQGSVALNAEWNNHTLGTNTQFRYCLNQIKEKDDSYYRIYSCLNDDYSANNGMLNNYGGTGYFHSVYNYYIDDFTKSVSMRSDSKAVGGYYLGKYQDLDEILGIKYYMLDKKRMLKDEIEAQNPGNFQANVPFSYEFEENYSNDSFITYENKEFIDLAYSYDSYTFDTIPQSGISDYGYGSLKQAIRYEQAVYLNKEDKEQILLDSEGDLNEVSSPTAFMHYATLSFGKDLESYNMTYYQLTDDDLGRDICSNPKNHLKEISRIPNIAAKAYPGKVITNERTWMWITNNDADYLFDENTAIYISMTFSNIYHFNFYFIGMNDEVFMFDDHNNYSTNNPNPVRGFYPRQKVKAIAVRGDYQLYTFADNIMRYETKDEYSARLNKLREYKVKNVKYGIDKYTFTTDFSKHRLMTTHFTYDPGWKIYAKDNEGKETQLKTYNGQGGFLSFVSLKGDASYTLVYETPYLQIGKIMTAFGIGVAFLTYIGYQYLNDKKKQKELFYL